MFDFMQMLHNYNERLVLRFEDKPSRLFISTASVNDGYRPYETAVSHPDYNKRKWVIVEAYDSADLARAGHGRWVRTMTANPPPDRLKDCINSPQAAALRSLGDPMEFPRQPL